MFINEIIRRFSEPTIDCVSWRDQDGLRYRLDILIDGEIIGHLELIPYADHLKVNDAFIESEYRNLGYGKIVYQEAIKLAEKLGLPELRSGYSVSPDAVRVWKSIGGTPFDESRSGTIRWHIKIKLPKTYPRNLYEAPDFSYSQFNDRDADIDKMVWNIVSDSNGIEISASKIPFDLISIGWQGNPLLYGRIRALRKHNAVQIISSYVKPEWYGTGLGQMLYDRLIKQAKQDGYKYVRSDNKESLSPRGENAWRRLAKRYPVVFNDQDPDPQKHFYIIPMDRVKLTESNSNVRLVDVQTDFGSAEGYVAPTTAEQLKNWLGYHYVRDAKKIMDYLQSKYSEFAVLNNINVDDNYRHKGHGSSILSEWLEDAGPVPVLLIADLAEENDFELQSWYEEFGFKVIAQTDSGPLMLLEPNEN